MDKVSVLIEKLNATGVDKVKENLRHGRYSSWKIPHVEEWLKEQDRLDNVAKQLP